MKTKNECGDTNQVLGLSCNREQGHGNVHTHDDGNTARSWGFAPNVCTATDHTACTPGGCGTAAAALWGQPRPRVVLPHHLPLLDLTADEVAAIREEMAFMVAAVPPEVINPQLRSALDKLTTSEEADR